MSWAHNALKDSAPAPSPADAQETTRALALEARCARSGDRHLIGKSTYVPVELAKRRPLPAVIATHVLLNISSLA